MKKMAQAYLLGGVNGVGKSKLFERLQESRPEMDVVHTASLLMEWLDIKPGDYDSLRSLPDRDKNRECGNAIRARLARAAIEQTVVFDFHYLNLIDGVMGPTVEGAWPAVMNGLIMVDARPDTVYRRVRGDARDRRLFPQGRPLPAEGEKATIANFVGQTRAEFGRLAASYALPNLVIGNDTPLDTAIAIDRFLEFDKRVRSEQ